MLDNKENNMAYNIQNRYDQMYEFENNRQLYAFRFKDTKLPMWMFARQVVIEAVVYNKGYIAKHRIFNAKRHERELKKNYWQKYITKNPYFARKRDIIFAFWEYCDLRQHDDGIVYEDFIMPFMRIFPQNTTTLMNGSIQNRYELNCAHPNWKMNEIFIDILRHIKLDVNVNDKKQIKEFINFLENNSPFPIGNDIKKEIYVKLSSFAQYLKPMIWIYEQYLQIVKPKVVIMFCASYPDILRTSMIIACKKKNVITAELQHGWVGKYHSNYYYGNYIDRNNKYNKMMPDYFLTFGNYWSNQVKIPSKCNVIGYAKPIIEDNVPNNSSILFCAGFHFEIYMKLLDIIMPELKDDTKIYFRFHPTYSSQKQKNFFNKYLKYSNFWVADEKDLNHYMKECRYVIVDGSTIAYEALAVGRIVFAIESELSIKLDLNKLSGVHMFQDANDFMELWRGRNRLEAVHYKEFFDLNYKERYIKFLKRCGVNTDIK